MDKQMTINDLVPEVNIILASSAKEAEKIAKEKIGARNKAYALIGDAKARYIKDKTRARSKKATEEKDAILKSPRFEKLNDYDRKSDILEAYGWDMITEKERDELETLWDEREMIRNKTEDGIYKDLVTEALDAACFAIVDLWDDEIEKNEMIVRNFKKQRIEAEIERQEWLEKQNKIYRELTGGDKR